MCESETRITQAESEADMETVRELFTSYAAMLGFAHCFQDFEQELASLPGAYAPPRGQLLLARTVETGAAVGCVGVRPDGLDRCEMKRLYVAPEARGRGIGRRLAVAAMDAARDAGYRFMRLETVRGTMATAIALYTDLEFGEIPAPPSTCCASGDDVAIFQRALRQ
ncbi:MAG: GNAT family N-acetyltransferase [Oceanidesulfovibrio sp.]